MGRAIATELVARQQHSFGGAVRRAKRVCSQLRPVLRRYRVSLVSRRYRQSGHESRLPHRDSWRGGLRGTRAETERNLTAEGKDSPMSHKGKRNETLELHADPIKPHTVDTSAHHAPSYEEIRRRAYEIYIERDGLGGNEVDDWIQAEAELRGDAFVRRTEKEAE